MRTNQDLWVACDTYIVKLLERETERINRLDARVGLRQVQPGGVVREIIAERAVDHLLAHAFRAEEEDDPGQAGAGGANRFGRKSMNQKRSRMS